MHDWVVRQYRADDIEAMFALDCVCFAEAFRFSRRAIRRFAEERGAVSLVAEAGDGRLAGFVIVHREGRAKERHGYVLTLDVAAEQRRLGLASHLLGDAERRLAEDGVQAMALHVFVENEAAISFYERAGYARLGVDTGFYGAGFDAFVYVKDLRAVSVNHPNLQRA